MQAYKRAALRYHPDKAPAEERVEAEKKFKQVGAAHAILSDPSKRQKYDAGEPRLHLKVCALAMVAARQSVIQYGDLRGHCNKFMVCCLIFLACLGIRAWSTLLYLLFRGPHLSMTAGRTYGRLEADIVINAAESIRYEDTRLKFNVLCRLDR